ncbi:MAG TPA: hypothetical protein VMN77_11765 [Nitrospiria bacterium]|nr:hypothetical protein [Nitrospiria bacterium]
MIALAACALPRAGLLMPDGSTVYIINSRVEFVDHARRPVQVDHPPKDIVLYFPYIPGQFNGSFNSPPLQTLQVIEGSEFQLDLGRMSRRLDEAAETLKNTVETEGLTIDPPSTRFARVATLAYDRNTGNAIGGSSFIDAESREYLILVYVDRPCSFSGSTHISSYGSVYDIRLPRPGFHWLRAHALGERSFILREYTGENEAIFSIEIQKKET